MTEQEKDTNRYFTKEDTNKHIKRYSTLAIREMEIKTTTSYHYTRINTTKIKNTDYTNAGKNP